MANSGRAPIGRSSIETISPKPIEEQIDDLLEWLEVDQPQLMGDIQELKAQIKALLEEARELGHKDILEVFDKSLPRTLRFTKNEQRVMRFVLDYEQEHGEYPPHKVMVKELGFNSTGTTGYYISKIKSKAQQRNHKERGD